MASAPRQEIGNRGLKGGRLDKRPRTTSGQRIIRTGLAYLNRFASSAASIALLLGWTRRAKPGGKGGGDGWRGRAMANG